MRQASVADHKIVSIEILVKAFIEDARLFISELEADSVKLALAEEKINKLLFVQ